MSIRLRSPLLTHGRHKCQCSRKLTCGHQCLVIKAKSRTMYGTSTPPGGTGLAQRHSGNLVTEAKLNISNTIKGAEPPPESPAVAVGCRKLRTGTATFFAYGAHASAPRRESLELCAHASALLLTARELHPYIINPFPMTGCSSSSKIFHRFVSCTFGHISQTFVSCFRCFKVFAWSALELPIA